jgi:hypothetical protein
MVLSIVPCHSDWVSRDGAVAGLISGEFADDYWPRRTGREGQLPADLDNNRLGAAMPGAPARRASLTGADTPDLFSAAARITP